MWLAYFWPFSAIACSIMFVAVGYLFCYSLKYKTFDHKDYKIFQTSSRRLTRRLGYFEKFFFFQGNIGSMHTVLLLDSEVKLDQRHVKKALLMLLERFPLLRMRVRNRFKELWFEEMENPQCLDFRIEDVDAEEWQGQFQRLINGAPFNAERGPLWRVTLLRETSGTQGLQTRYTNALLFSFHHIICDSLSIYALKKKLLEFLTLLYVSESIEVESLPFQPPIECLMYHLIAVDIRERLLRSANLMFSKVRAMFYNHKKTNLYLSTFPPPGDNLVPEKTYVIPCKLTREETLAIIRCSKVNKCTVHGAITAAAHLAMSQLLNQNNSDLKIPLLIRSTYPVNIRKECEPLVQKDEFGLYASFNSLQMMVNSIIVVEQAQAFWEFARSCTSEIHRSIESGEHRNFLKLFQCVNIPEFCVLSSNENAYSLKKALFNLNNLGSLHIDEEGNSPYNFAGSYLALQSAKIDFLIGNNILTVNDCLYWTVEFCPEITTIGQAEEFFNLTFRILMDACSSNDTTSSEHSIFTE